MDARIRWLTDLVGYGPAAGGNLTSGGMMANFIGLKLARDWASGDRAQHEGIHERWAVYVSEERHVCVDKAVDAIGIGRASLRALPTDSEFQIRLDALESAIEQDRKRGIRPMCLIGIFGTTNTGASTPSATCARLPTANECGSMRTLLMAAACCFPPNRPCATAASSWRTPSPSIRTSGSTLRSMLVPS